MTHGRIDGHGAFDPLSSSSASTTGPRRHVRAAAGPTPHGRRSWRCFGTSADPVALLLATPAFQRSLSQSRRSCTSPVSQSPRHDFIDASTANERVTRRRLPARRRRRSHPRAAGAATTRTTAPDRCWRCKPADAIDLDGYFGAARRRCGRCMKHFDARRPVDRARRRLRGRLARTSRRRTRWSTAAPPPAAAGSARYLRASRTRPRRRSAPSRSARRAPSRCAVRRPARSCSRSADFELGDPPTRRSSSCCRSCTRPSSVRSARSARDTIAAVQEAARDASRAQPSPPTAPCIPRATSAAAFARSPG